MPTEVPTKFPQDADGLLIVKENNAEQLGGLFNRAIAAALEEIGLKAERYAKIACHVDTGRLRNSITHAIDAGRHEVMVGTNVEYAPYVELGTRRSKAYPFLTQAATEHGEEYRAILKKHMSS